MLAKPSPLLTRLMALEQRPVIDSHEHLAGIYSLGLEPYHA